jgi:peptidoglycan/xylan/chitin deacetylase (PgdA/CDA1 family)
MFNICCLHFLSFFFLCFLAPEFYSHDAKLTILTYHSVRPHLAHENSSLKHYTVSPDAFEKQLKYLKDQDYHVIGFQDLLDALLYNRPLPARPVILTFDDGWENQYQYAFPLLKKYQMVGTFFIYTHPIGTIHANGYRSFLSWAQIREMDHAGMTIGGHTQTHPLLLKLKHRQDIAFEIAGGKKIIEQHLGHAIDFFAYPYGEYNDMIIKEVKKAGFLAARSCVDGKNQSLALRYQLLAFEVTDSFEVFLKLLKD